MIKQVRLAVIGLAFSLVMAAVPSLAAELRSHDTDLSESVPAGTTLEVDSLLGSIVATRAQGERAAIVAHTTARDSDPAAVQIRVVRTPGHVLVCAVYPGENADCRHRAHHNEDRTGDITVDFTLTVPSGVRFIANTVSGNVRAIGLQGDVRVATVRGDVTLATAGRAEATTINGSLDVRLGLTDWPGELQFRTVDGDIRLTLARDSNVALDAATLSGAIRGTRGVTLANQDGAYVGHSATARLGKGGSRLSLHTISGEITVGSD